MKETNHISHEHTRPRALGWQPQCRLYHRYTVDSAEPQLSTRQVDSPDTLYRFYRNLLALRKSDKTFVSGHYALLLPNDEAVYAYTRTLNNEHILVACNFTDHEVPCALLNDWQDAELLISNYDTSTNPSVLRSFETVVYRK